MTFKRSPRPSQVLDTLNTAVVVIDPSLKITYLNTSAEVLFGVSTGHAMGLRVDQGVPHLHDQVKRLQASIDNGVAYVAREVHLRKPTNGGDPVNVDCSYTPMLSARGQRLLVLEFASLDRHMRISREGQLHAQHELSREVVRGLAHEIKNPLGGLRGAAQLLASELDDPSAVELTDIIIREADRLHRLVDRMLGPNRRPDYQRINIHQVLEHVFALVEVDKPDNIELIRDYDPSLPPIVADREQLIQTFLNIVRNAVHALAQSGFGDGQIILRSRARRQLTLSGARHRLVLQIDVEDNGPGIDEAMQEKIFYPLVTSRADGSGLGLSIAQYLIHSHGGLIECHSQRAQFEPGAEASEPARGLTRFSVLLPISQDNQHD